MTHEFHKSNYISLVLYFVCIESAGKIGIGCKNTDANHSKMHILFNAAPNINDFFFCRTIIESANASLVWSREYFKTIEMSQLSFLLTDCFGRFLLSIMVTVDASNRE